MLYLSDLEEALGSLDSVSMTSVFDLDKFDMKSELADITDLISPYLVLLSPLDKTLFDMYYIHEARAEYIASYLDISTTAVYKRIRAINIKIKLVIYLNMDKEELFRFLKAHWINDTVTADYIVQFIFHRTSKVKQETELYFQAIIEIKERLEAVVNAGVSGLDNFSIGRIRRNNKRHQAIIKLRRIVEVIDFIIAKKAYRYNIFRGTLEGNYAY